MKEVIIINCQYICKQNRLYLVNKTPFVNKYRLVSNCNLAIEIIYFIFSVFW